MIVLRKEYFLRKIFKKLFSKNNKSNNKLNQNFLKEEESKFFKKIIKEKKFSQTNNIFSEHQKLEEKKKILIKNIIYEKNKEIYIKIIARPNKKKNSIEIVDDILYININAIQKEGKANSEILYFFSLIFKIDKNFINIFKGTVSKNKIIKLNAKSNLSVNKIVDLLFES